MKTNTTFRSQMRREISSYLYVGILLGLLLIFSLPLQAQTTFLKHNIGVGNVAHDITPGDIDGDGHVDIVAGYRNSSKLVWLENDGSENFTEHTISNSLQGVEEVIIFDLDVNGDMDIITVSSNPMSIIWWENDGSENFTQHVIDNALSFAYGIDVVDLDGDGHHDLIGAATQSNAVYWYEHDGSGNFTKNLVKNNITGAFKLDAADIDADGHMDILVSTAHGDKVLWLQNDGSESFTKNTIASGFDYPKDINAADIDGDGKLDIVSVALQGNDLYWWKNKGDSTFSSNSISKNYRTPHTALPVDLDQDGHMDILTGRGLRGSSAFNTPSSGEITWWENDGNESFTPHQIFDNYSYMVKAFDMDGDGDLDVLSSGNDLLFLEACSGVDNDGDGVGNDCDCDDADPDNYPGNEEVCDGKDNNCDGMVDHNDPELIDITPPVLICPSHINQVADHGSCNTTVTYSISSSDDCGSATHSQTDNAGLTSGNLFPVGTTTQTFTATDAFGNTSNCSFEVNISDNEKPVISLLGDNPLYICSGGSYVDQGATATDNCAVNLTPQITIDASQVNMQVEGIYQVYFNVTDLNGNVANQMSRSVIVMETPDQLSPQNCGSCSQIRFDFCEGEPTPDLEALLATNASYTPNSDFLWYTDNSGSQGSSISTPAVNTTSKNTNFYWVSQQGSGNGCESEARRVRVRVRKTSTVILDLPAIGCNTGQIDLASYVSDGRNFATGYSFYDRNPDVGSPTPVGSVTANKGIVNSGQYAVVSLPEAPVTYYAVASNNTGCQVTGSNEVSSAAGASLASIANQTVNAGDQVTVNFSSPNATMIVWYNLNTADIGLIGNMGTGNLLFTSSNTSGSSLTANMRAIAYNGNCAGEVRDFTLTVLPGTQNRQTQNAIQLTASKLNAHDVQVDWHIDYEFELTHIEIEKQKNGGDWEMIGTSENLHATHIDRGGMGNLTKYRLKLIHADGRAIWSQEVEVNFDFYDNKRFTLYPNPSNGHFQLRAAGTLEGDWRYKLSDQLGQTLQIGKLQGSETAFDISHIPAGHYFLLLTSPEGKRYLERVVKN